MSLTRHKPAIVATSVGADRPAAEPRPHWRWSRLAARSRQTAHQRNSNCETQSSIRRIETSSDLSRHLQMRKNNYLWLTVLKFFWSFGM